MLTYLTGYLRPLMGQTYAMHCPGVRGPVWSESAVSVPSPMSTRDTRPWQGSQPDAVAPVISSSDCLRLLTPLAPLRIEVRRDVRWMEEGDAMLPMSRTRAKEATKTCVPFVPERGHG